jgi:hypothetical protein
MRISTDRTMEGRDKKGGNTDEGESERGIDFGNQGQRQRQIGVEMGARWISRRKRQGGVDAVQDDAGQTMVCLFPGEKEVSRWN